MRSFLAALVLATSVAAAAISGRETAAGLVDDGLSIASGEAPVTDHAGFMGIAVETLQIAGQLSGYADTPKHRIYQEKLPAIPQTP